MITESSKYGGRLRPNTVMCTQLLHCTPQICDCLLESLEEDTFDCKVQEIPWVSNVTSHDPNMLSFSLGTQVQTRKAVLTYIMLKSQFGD